MDKKVYYLVGSVGTTLGGSFPTLFGKDGLSMWSIFGGLAGGLGAIILVYRLSR